MTIGQKSMPSPSLASDIAFTVTGMAPRSTKRFATGSRHYVYEATFDHRPALVVRMGDQRAHAEMAGAVHLSCLLRPLGVPLPQLVAHNTEAPIPWLVLERLPGVDLRDTIGSLSETELDLIAERVAAAQEIVAHTGSAGRYGYAVEPELAPFKAWAEVFSANLERSRQRIGTAQLFDVALLDRLENLLALKRHQLNSITATPFLHDTTTKNVIIGPNGAFSGIVDVDDLCFGDPRYPAALTLAVLLGYGGPVAYVSSWLGYSDQVDDDVFRLYVALFLADLMAEHGHVFNGNQQPSNPTARAQLRAAFEENLLLAK